MGCIGIAIVSLSVNKDSLHKLPLYRQDAFITAHYELAYEKYNELLKDGAKPALLMYLYNRDTNYDNLLKLEWIDKDFDLDKNTIHSGYDYCTLVDIDVNHGKETCWIHAVEGWKNHFDKNKEYVIVTPYKSFETPEEKVPLFIVIPQTGRYLQGRYIPSYEITFEIPWDLGDYIPQYSSSIK